MAPAVLAYEAIGEHDRSVSLFGATEFTSPELRCSLRQNFDQRQVRFGELESPELARGDPAIAFVILGDDRTLRRAAEPEVQVDRSVRIREQSVHQEVDDLHFEAGLFEAFTARAQARRFIG